MKVYISVDMEGAFDAGATEVFVQENHREQNLCVLKTDEIDSRCCVIRGAERAGVTRH